MNLELWRKTKQERGMTYQDISDRSGIPLGTIKNIFAGYTPDPRDSTIKAIERALGVATIIERRPMNLSSEELHLLETYRKLDTYNRLRVATYADLRLEEQGTPGTAARKK